MDQIEDRTDHPRRGQDRSNKIGQAVVHGPVATCNDSLSLLLPGTKQDIPQFKEDIGNIHIKLDLNAADTKRLVEIVDSQIMNQK